MSSYALVDLNFLPLPYIDIDIDNTTLITKLLLTGHPELTFNENVSLCKSVQNYINNTKRF